MRKIDYYGDGEEYTVSSDPLYLKPNGPRAVTIAGGDEPITINVRLPNATQLSLGGVHFIIVNTTGAKQVQIKDYGGDNIALLGIASDEGGLFSLVDGSSEEGTWIAFVGNVPAA